MALPSGTRLGPYEILAPLGAGGMGEVYRAADTRLNRTVAVKVLPSGIADDPDRRQCFEREARAVSSLSHPHICALYDVGRQDDIEFLVMEYVEGDTLEARVMSGPLALDQALQYGTEIAGALDHAHRRGIIHRDLKPSNIMVTPAGVKVLDFGLAKAISPDPAAMVDSVSGTPTRTATLTAHGMILGTLQYAAPEQLEGRAADARSDIFACGAVLHEMLTGRKAFEGTSPASLIAAVLRTEPPPLTSVQPTLPAALDRAVRKCLSKNPDDRWQTARDLMSELAWIRESGSRATVAHPLAEPRRPVHRGAWIAAGACVVATAVALSAVARMRFRPVTNDASAVQFAVAAPETASFLECNNCMALSPDGRYLAFIARSGDARELLWVRALDSVAARPLAETDGARGPFWAPDSQTIGFHAKGKLKRVDVTGANLHTIAEQPQGLGSTWNQDGIILFSPGEPGTGLFRVPAAGGAPTAVTRPDPSRAEGVHTWPWFLPDGRHFLYRAFSRQDENTAIFVGSLDSPERTLVVAANSNPVYVAPGYLVYGTNGTLMAQPFDASSLRLSGVPTVIAQPVRYNPSSGRSAFSASERAIAYQEAANTELTWFDRNGKALGKMGGPGHYQDPTLSPDGQQLAVVHVEADIGTSHLWLVDVTRGSSVPLTSGSGWERSPIWSPDGRFIVFAAKRTSTFDLYQRPVNGASGDERALAVQAALPLDWSRDGRFIVYLKTGQQKLDVFALEGGPHPASPPTRFGELQGQFSANGRWIAYASNETGQHEIYVRAFEGSGGKTMISRGGGVEPKWRRDGKEIFYLAPDGRLMAADVTSDGTFSAAPPKALFATRAQGSTAFIIGRNQYDVSADGQRFLISVPAEGTTSPITVDVNWPAALRR